MDHEPRIDELLSRMTLAEKVGQMRQISPTPEAHEGFEDLVRRGAVGSFLNVLGDQARAYQRLAVEESRLGIPLIFGRDVIHGFRTVFPIPLGQAASFDPDLAREGARIAAREATSCGVKWTFAPMVDVARDPRWGRIAEGSGEDPYLASQMGAAMVQGFQGPDPSDPERLAACPKHYVGYGAAEGGRDYNTTWIPEGLLRDVYLVPFEACVRAGAATLMSAFNDLNGIPASGNAFTLRKVLKGEWAFDGFVVSDWASVVEMIPHGYAADERGAALKAVAAGVDMEMATAAYPRHLEALVADGSLPLALIDEAVRRILRIKLRLGLFEHPYWDDGRRAALLCDEHLAAARRAARQSCVLLKNDGLLPLAEGIRRLAVVGPLADDGRDQLGCWVLDGEGEECHTPLAALRELLGARKVAYAPGLSDCRSTAAGLIPQAVAAARGADAVVAFLGEDADLSGEAHSRAYLDLPGAQQQLLDALAATGKPVVVVVMAGRPLALSPVLEKAGALLLAWHPGTMGGPAIADLLFGREAPSGRLPASLPRTVGQVPIYYNHMNTGRPAPEQGPGAAGGTALEPWAFHAGYLDVDHRPLFPFGYGLTYTTFEYRDLELSTRRLKLGQALTASVTVANTGRVRCVEVAQLYIRDLVASVTRPIRELRGFQRVELGPGESRLVTFELHTADLAFHDANMRRVTEPGNFHLWIGPDAQSGLRAEFEVVE